MSGREEMQQALLTLGEKRMQAAILSILMDKSPVTTHEIMEETGLRQPEVSIGVRDLKARGWVEARPIPREGKGRPMNEYLRTFDSASLSSHYLEAARRLKTETDAAADVISARMT